MCSSDLFQMIHRHERDAKAIRRSLRTGHADEQRADQTRAGGDCDAIDVAPSDVGIAEGARHQRKKMLQMFALGDLRHDSAERLVPLDLRGDEVHAHAAVVAEERDRGLVAGGLDAENHDRAETNGPGRDSL